MRIISTKATAEWLTVHTRESSFIDGCTYNINLCRALNTKGTVELCKVNSVPLKESTFVIGCKSVVDNHIYNTNCITSVRLNVM